MLEHSVNTPDNTIARNPEDFSLSYLGTFDVTKGIYENSKNGPRHICLAISLVKKQNLKDMNQMNLFEEEKVIKDHINKE